METTQNAQSQEVDVSSVYLPDQCREVSPNGQEKITRDIQEKGLIQEIVVAEMPDGRKELVAGQRRFKAVQALGWQKIRARVLPLGISELDKELVRIAENDEREDVNPFDRALSYQRALKAAENDQRKLAGLLGESERVVSGVLALLSFSPEVLENLRRRKFSAGHLGELVRLPDAEAQLKMADACEKSDCSVKVLRDKVSRALAGNPEKAAQAPAEPASENGPFQFARKGKFLVLKTKMPPVISVIDDVYMQDLRIAMIDFIAQENEKEARMDQAA